MENFGGFGFTDSRKTVRKRRSNSSRRPRNDSQTFAECHDNSSLSSTPPSDNVSRASSDDNNGYGTNSWKKELNLNQCSSSRASSTNLVEVETTLKMNNEDVGFIESNDSPVKGNKHSGIGAKRCSEGVLAPANWKSMSKVNEGLELQSRAIDTQISKRISGSYSSGHSEQSEIALDGPGSDNKVKKVKLKVGGVTRTIHAKSTSVDASVGGSSSTKYSRSSDAPRPRKKLILQDSSDDNHSSSPDNGSGLHGVPWKDFSRSGFRATNMNSLRGKKPEESVSIKQSEKNESVRKSKRAPKPRLLDGAFDDEELWYIDKVKTAKVATDYNAEFEDDEEVGSKKKHKISKVLKRKVDTDHNVDSGDHSYGKEAKKSRSGRASEDTDYLEEEEEEEEAVSDGEPETKREKQRKELVDILGDSKREMAVTTRRRAVQTGKDISSSAGASFIEFPNGLPPAPPRKQKEKLSEVELQLKKAEAAQRRRMQMEKAARESEAEAIRKILGQDSSRKKREDKMKKRQEDLAQERAANAMTLSSNAVRWVMGPAGTVVTFPYEIGLPSIFETKHCSYPPPREKCAGPSCTNPYKYRDSKSKLPLCSLQCYKAIHEKIRPMTAC